MQENLKKQFKKFLFKFVHKHSIIKKFTIQVSNYSTL